MENTDIKIQRLAAAGIIAAVYAVFTMVIPPIAYVPPFEFRLSEILCILPFFFPAAVPGLFIGCLIANLLSPVGILDVVFGSLASLIAALATAAIGTRAFRREREGKKIGWGSCVLACAMPVLVNAPIIGAVLSYVYTPDAFWPGFWTFALEVGVGEAAVLFVLGLPAMRFLINNDNIRGYLDKLR